MSPSDSAVNEVVKNESEESTTSGLPTKDAGDSECSDKENSLTNKSEDCDQSSDTQRQDDVTENTEEKRNVRFLTYLDEACSRWRLNNLGLTLKESQTGQHLFDQLVALSKEHEKERLCRILNDISTGRIVNRSESCMEDNTS